MYHITILRLPYFKNLTQLRVLVPFVLLLGLSTAAFDPSFCVSDAVKHFCSGSVGALLPTVHRG